MDKHTMNNLNYLTTTCILKIVMLSYVINLLYQSTLYQYNLFEQKFPLKSRRQSLMSCFLNEITCNMFFDVTVGASAASLSNTSSRLS